MSEVSLGLPSIGEGGAINWDVLYELVSVADYYMTFSVAHHQCGADLYLKWSIVVVSSHLLPSHLLSSLLLLVQGEHNTRRNGCSCNEPIN